ncbi:hypothetical protein [Pseudoduganella violaceinigra]|uniref:hypothetical protein n=1 Tax=Pseudoduganella violaceinigra TaxID=246602 RepID=UPI0012B5A590|nr:hypothetical protein [Pseudoduganella violaceinigra]
MLDQRGTRMVLVLASYETVAWQLDVRPGTVLAAVVVSAYRDVAVAGHGAAPAFRLALPCAPTPGSAAYQDLMQILQARLGRGQPDLFRGYERLPEQVAIAAGGPVVGAVLPSQARMRRQLHTWQAAGQDVLHARRQTAGATPGRTAPLTASAAARRAWA